MSWKHWNKNSKNEPGQLHMESDSEDYHSLKRDVEMNLEMMEQPVIVQN